MKRKETYTKIKIHKSKFKYWLYTKQRNKFDLSQTKNKKERKKDVQHGQKV